MRDVDKRLSRLEARYNATAVREVVTLNMRHGEDRGFILDAWRRRNPDSSPTFILMSIFGAIPRLELGLCSRESVLDALPGIKSFVLQQRDETREAWAGEWRPIARAAGADFDAIEPVRPGEQGDANDPYQ